jgi:hypothetical protein
MKTFNPMNPVHAWKLRREGVPYAKWMMGRWFQGRDRQQVSGMNRSLAEHVSFALDQCQRHAGEISAAMRKHQMKLPDRQCRMAELSQRVQDTMVILVTALWGHRQSTEMASAAADILCQDLRLKLTGQRPSDRYFRDIGRLADMVIAGGFKDLAGIEPQEILMKY